MTRPMPGRARRLICVLALACSLLLTGCEFNGAYDLPLPGGEVSKAESFEVTAEFADVSAVVPRSTVMVNDVPVGQVESVDRVGWHAKVTLRLRRDVKLPDNAFAEIAQTSLLGEKYVKLSAPAAAASGQLSEGDTIPLANTGRNPEVEEVLGALSFLLSGGGVGQIATITKELNAVMSGRTDRIRSLLQGLNDVVGTLDSQKVAIISAMQSINNLTKTLNRQQGVITDALDVMDPTVRVLSRQHDSLVTMLQAVSDLGTVGTRVIRASRKNFLASLRHLTPILRKLNEAGDSLAPGLSTGLSFPFPDAAKDAVKGDYANTQAMLTVDLNGYSIPGLPGLPTLPDLGLDEVLDQLEGLGLPDPGALPDLGANKPAALKADPAAPAGLGNCLASRSLVSKSCAPLIADETSFTALVASCTDSTYAAASWMPQPVCRALRTIALTAAAPLPGAPNSTPVPGLDPGLWGEPVLHPGGQAGLLGQLGGAL